MSNISIVQYRQICFAAMFLIAVGLSPQAHAEDGPSDETHSEEPSQTDDGFGAVGSAYSGSETGTSLSRPSMDATPGEGQSQGEKTALQNQHILPLDNITASTQKLTNGRILDAELTQRRGSLRYELKVLENDDRLRRYWFDARSGRLIGVK
ncbi:hypothetical protein [Agrobacterium sp. SORGH_AS 787]|uniref:PepSY domain-containing protein n=1 Tax=Agrobacterium sp. SORGH_AS 787 TaxID=3041775 RepID=UPI0032B862C6